MIVDVDERGLGQRNKKKKKKKNIDKKWSSSARTYLTSTWHQVYQYMYIWADNRDDVKQSESSKHNICGCNLLCSAFLCVLLDGAPLGMHHIFSQRYGFSLLVYSHCWFVGVSGSPFGCSSVWQAFVHNEVSYGILIVYLRKKKKHAMEAHTGK